MGWWDVQGTNLRIGDQPLDTLGIAIAEIVKTYQDAWGRPPTPAEWACLFETVLGTKDAVQVFGDDGQLERVRLDFAKRSK